MSKNKRNQKSKKVMYNMSYSPDTDSLIIELNNKPIDYAEEFENMIIHYTKAHEPVLIELMDAKQFSLNMMETIIKEKKYVEA